MSNIDKRALRDLATALDGDDWHAEGNSVYGGRYDVGDSVCYDHIASCESVNGESPLADFIAAANPATVLALLDDLEAAEHTAAVDHEAACSLVEENEEVKRKLAAAEKRIAELREWNAGLAQESFERQQRIAETSCQKRLIGWRASDYTDETSDPELAKNWAAAIGVLPIFEGDVNTKLSAAGIGKGE